MGVDAIEGLVKLFAVLKTLNAIADLALVKDQHRGQGGQPIGIDDGKIVVRINADDFEGGVNLGLELV